MASLYKRASPREALMLRIISGAVLNTADAHPGKYNIDAKFARGAAKRAVGTLSASWADLLAAESRRPSGESLGTSSQGLKREGTQSSRSRAQLVSAEKQGPGDSFSSPGPISREE